MAEYSSSSYERNIGPVELLQKVWNDTMRNFGWDINKVLVMAWILFGVYVIFSRQWKILLPGAGIFTVRMAIWCWLYWRGRTPARVTVPLMACETILMLALVWIGISKTKKTVWLNGALLICCVLFCWASLNSVKLEYRYIKKENEVQKVYTEGLKELLRYCNENEQNRYLIDCNTVSFYRGNVLETEIYQPANAVIGGGWFSGSPHIQQRIKEYLSSAEDGIYVIIYADGNQEAHPTIVYMEEMMGTEAVLEDELVASHGGKYGVYYFEGAFPFE